MAFTGADLRFMQRALALAEHAAKKGEVPVGAVLVRGGEVLGEGYNQVISASDPTAHAEVVALRDAAARVDNYRLPHPSLPVSSPIITITNFLHFLASQVFGGCSVASL